VKKASANRGGERTIPPAKRAAGAFGKYGRGQKAPARAPAAGKGSKPRGKAQGRRAA
jgi:hypothetical protein